jgi:NAD+ diphosphatase
MNNRAFFFQGDTLLLPADFPDALAAEGVSSELAKDFNNPDAFETPSIDKSTEPIRAVFVLPGVELPQGWRFIPVRQVLSMIAAGTAGGGSGRILRACHIAQWRNDSRFCGTCGAKNVDGSPEPHRICPKCGRIEYPRICPAMIVLITDDQDRILLAHNKKFKAGMYSLVSGFNDAGETLEDTVVREIREEVNIEVKDIEYVKSQSWPFPNSLMLGFKAHYLSGEIRPDGVEIEDAKWFTRDNLPDIPMHGSLSRFLIESWKNG